MHVCLHSVRGGLLFPFAGSHHGTIGPEAAARPDAVLVSGSRRCSLSGTSRRRRVYFTKADRPVLIIPARTFEESPESETAAEWADRGATGGQHGCVRTATGARGPAGFELGPATAAEAGGVNFRSRNVETASRASGFSFRVVSSADGAAYQGALADGIEGKRDPELPEAMRGEPNHKNHKWYQ